jgi:predicted ATPase
VEATYARARELCEQVGETPQRFPALMGVSTYYMARGQVRQACELREQLLALAQRQQDPDCLPQAHVALGTILFWRGAFSQAYSHLEQGLRFYEQEPSRTLAPAGDDLGVSSRRVMALALWVLGYPEQALQRSHEALTQARQLSHAFSLAFGLSFAAMLHQYRREAYATSEQAEAVIEMAREHGFPRWEALGAILRGWARAEQGQGEEGIAQIRQGVAAWRGQGQELTRPYHLALLAQAHSHIGQVAEGLHILAEALALVDSTEEGWCEAELYRLKGKLLLAQSAEHHAAAETCFQQALAVARHQQAKSLELRAAMSLSRLWQQQGKRQEACRLFAPIYGWFTEGFDTTDLQEAKALLEELSA